MIIIIIVVEIIVEVTKANTTRIPERIEAAPTRTLTAKTLKTTIPAQSPNSMGRNTRGEQLQALLLSNCALRFLVSMAVAHMTCYQHFISKTSMVHACFEKQTL